MCSQNIEPIPWDGTYFQKVSQKVLDDPFALSSAVAEARLNAWKKSGAEFIFTWPEVFVYTDGCSGGIRIYYAIPTGNYNDFHYQIGDEVDTNGVPVLVRTLREPEPEDKL